MLEQEQSYEQKMSGNAAGGHQEDRTDHFVFSVLAKNEIGCFTVDLITDELFYTPELAQIVTGDRNTKLSRVLLTEYLRPEDRLLRQAAYAEMFETGRLDYEPQVVWKDGSVHRIRIIGRCSYNEAGEPQSFSGIVELLQSPNDNGNLTSAMQANFKLLIEQSPIAMCLLKGPELIVEIVNDHMLALTGKDQSAVGKPVKLAVPELQGQGFIEMMESVYRTGDQVAGSEVPAKFFRSGLLEEAYFNFVFAPSKDPYGNIRGVIVTASEVTKQVLSRKALESSEARFRSFVEEAPVAACLLVGPDMIIELANDLMIRYWRKDERIIGMPVRQALPELKDHIVILALDEIYKTGDTYEKKAVLAQLEKNGVPETGYYDVTLKPIKNAAGEVYAIIAMAFEVTEEILRRQQLEEIENALRSAIELAELGTWSIDPSNRTFSFSSRVGEWIGRNTTTIGIHELYQLISEHDREKISRAINAAMNPATGGVYDEEFTLINTNTGEERNVHAHGKAVFDEEGRALKMYGTAQDITMHRKLQLALEQKVTERTEELARTNKELQARNEQLAELNKILTSSNEELQQFAHVASHDLKEPLRKIKTFAGRIENDVNTQLSEDSRFALQKVHSSTKRMFAMIEGVLSYSTVNAADFESQAINLNNVIEEIKDDLEVMIDQKKAIIKYGRLPIIEGAPILIYQLFYNLIANSLKFSKADEQPVITLTAAEEITDGKSFSRIVLKDNGIGFAPENAEKIFNTFTRLNSKDKYEGTGLGLSLCRKIVQRHGGTITAAGQKNEGAEFTVLLPVHQNN